MQLGQNSKLLTVYDKLILSKEKIISAIEPQVLSFLKFKTDLGTSEQGRNPYYYLGVI